MRLMLAWIIWLFIVPAVWAAEPVKGPSCPEQLQEEKLLSQNVSQDRDNKERMVAKIQSIALALQQQVQTLQKQLADLKKPEEKPKE